MNKCTFRSIPVAGIFSLFLSSAAHAWTIDHSYDNYSNGEQCPRLSSKSVISSEKSASGGKSCKLSIEEGKTSGGFGGAFTFPSKLLKGDELWVRVRTYMPIDFDITADPHLKFLRVRTYAADGGNRGYNDWYINNNGSHKFIYEGRNDLGWNKVDSSIRVHKGTWETYEYYIKFDTKSVGEGGTGRMRAWQNGVLMKDMTDRVTLREATDYANKFHIFTYWNGASPATQSMFVDDVVVTNEKPLNTDKLGNPAIGMDGFVSAPVVSPPNPPQLN